MEVIIPSHKNNFDFNMSERSSPQISPPSTPKPFGNYYFSAPTSPTHLSQLYDGNNKFDDLYSTDNVESTSSAPKLDDVNGSFKFDTASQDQWENSSVSAEELFHGGVIKPLNPITTNVSRSVRRSDNNISTERSGVHDDENPSITNRPSHHERGRERKPGQRRSTRSLSPRKTPPQEGTAFCSALTTVKSGSGKKWSFKDLFLFRSASEGRASDKDPLKKYTEAVFRPTGSRRKGPVSAHEKHYTMNRAVSEDMKKKTFLPYKQGILGRLAFNPTVHALANGFGFSRK